MTTSSFSHAPKSSLIETVKWEFGEPPIMIVKFRSGKEYTYYDVPEDDYHAFAKAESAGSHFGRHIKGKYRKPDDA